MPLHLCPPPPLRRSPLRAAVEHPSSTPECPCSPLAARLRMGRCGRAGGRAARGSGYIGQCRCPKRDQPSRCRPRARVTPSTRKCSQAHAAPARMMESDAAISLLATTRCAQYCRVPVEHVYSTPSREYPLVPSRVPPKLPPHSGRESSRSAVMRPSRPRRVRSVVVQRTCSRANRSNSRVPWSTPNRAGESTREYPRAVQVGGDRARAELP
jgi:hypothetical protein